MKIALALAVALLPSVALAQTTAPAPLAVEPVPQFAWKIVLKNFLNHTQLVRPEDYPDRSTCELARMGMGYDEFQILGVHGLCVYVPTTFGRPKSK